MHVLKKPHSTANRGRSMWKFLCCLARAFIEVSTTLYQLRLDGVEDQTLQAGITLALQSKIGPLSPFSPPAYFFSLSDAFFENSRELSLRTFFTIPPFYLWLFAKQKENGFASVLFQHYETELGERRLSLFFFAFFQHETPDSLLSHLNDNDLTNFL